MSDNNDTTTRVRDEDSSWKHKTKQTILMIVTGAFCVSMIEYTITQNKIDLSAAAPITSTGQLLPVLLGVLTIGAIVVKVFWE